MEMDAVSLRRTALGLAAALALTSSAHAAPLGGPCIRAETPASGRLLAESPPGPIALGRAPRRVKLEPVCAADGRAVRLAQRVTDAAPRRRFLLVIEDLRAEAQPGVLFDLKLAAAPDGRAGLEPGALLGTLNFYAAQRPGVAARPRMVSYDVTEALKALAAARTLDGGLVVAVRPVADPAPGAGAAIGRIALVEQ
jgi:hypothetical protein